MGTNTIARYIKNNPTTTLPIFTITIFLASYFNKWGFFSYFKIQPSFINFNFTQLLPFTSWPSWQLWLIFISLVYGVYLMDKWSIKIRKQHKQSYGIDILSFSVQTSAVKTMGVLLVGVFSFVHSVFYFLLDNFYFYLIFSILAAISLSFFLLLKRYYMVTLVSLVACICFGAFEHGYYSAVNQKFVKVEGDYLVVDYIDDKYILIHESQLVLLKCDEKNHAPLFKINSIINSPLKVTENNVEVPCQND